MLLLYAVHADRLLAVKSIKQLHHCTELDKLMEEFRLMVNEAVRIGIAKNITSKLRLRNELYPRFKNGFHIDRDVNAARNIVARGMQFVPDAVQGEAMKQFKDVEQIAPSLLVAKPR